MNVSSLLKVTQTARTCGDGRAVFTAQGVPFVSGTKENLAAKLQPVLGARKVAVTPTGGSEASIEFALKVEGDPKKFLATLEAKLNQFAQAENNEL